MSQAEAALLVYILVSHVFFLYVLNKLVNKLMSRNYQEFAFAENSSRLKQTKSPQPSFDEVPEDLRPLQDLG